MWGHLYFAVTNSPFNFTGTDQMDGPGVHLKQDLHAPEWCVELRWVFFFSSCRQRMFSPSLLPRLNPCSITDHIRCVKQLVPNPGVMLTVLEEEIFILSKTKCLSSMGDGEGGQLFWCCSWDVAPGSKSTCQHFQKGVHWATICSFYDTGSTHLHTSSLRWTISR